MAAVPIQIDGVFYPYAKDAKSQPIAGSMIGSAFLVGIGIGGGPIIPAQPPAGGGSPGTPTHPIWGPPGITLPPGSGYPPVAGHPLPEPPDGGAPPDPPDMVKPPPPEGGWGWSPSYGWGYFPGSGGAGPKK